MPQRSGRVQHEDVSRARRGFGCMAYLVEHEESHPLVSDIVPMMNEDELGCQNERSRLPSSWREDGQRLVEGTFFLCVVQA